MVHAEEVAGEQCCFLSPGAGAHFEDRVTLIVAILWQEGQLHPLFKAGETLSQGAQLVLGKRLQLRIFTQFGQIRQGREFVPSAA